MERSFDFVLDNQHAIQNYKTIQTKSKDRLFTSVQLRKLRDGYDSQCPKKLETITHRIAAHFLPFLIGDGCPDIVVSNDHESHSLRKIIADHTYKPESCTFAVDNVGSFSIKHLLLSKSLVEKGTEHTIYLAAHNRIVSDHGINNQTGLDGPFHS